MALGIGERDIETENSPTLHIKIYGTILQGMIIYLRIQIQYFATEKNEEYSKWRKMKVWRNKTPWKFKV